MSQSLDIHPSEAHVAAAQTGGKGHATLGVFDGRVWTFRERPCVKAPLAGYTAFLTGGFHRAISCSVTVNEDGFPNYTNSNSLKIYHYPWLRLISWVTKINNIEMTTR